MGAEHAQPCAGLQVTMVRMDEFARWQKEQNGRLASIEAKLAEMAVTMAANRYERSQQIEAVAARIQGQYDNLLRAAIGLLVPVVAGLLYLVLGHVLVP